MNSSPVALEDIAQSLGIAVSTVSRALRELPGIHPATQAKIMRQAEMMGYVPPRKRNKDALQPANILLLTLGADATPRSYLAGMSRVAPALNISLQSHVSSHEDCLRVLDPKYQPPALKMGLVAGIILIYKWPDKVVQTLSEKLPVVSIILQYPEIPVDVVGIDHLRGMFPLVRHLQKTGHEQIGFFGLRPEVSWARSRFAAYAEALVAFGLPFDFDQVISISNMRPFVTFPILDEEAVDSIVRRIESGTRAWVCANDVLGNSLAAALVKKGYRIPQDVAITGFHRRTEPTPHSPVLTTTEVGDDLLGEAALQLMATRLSKKSDGPQTILLPSRFFQGETTLREDSPALHASPTRATAS